MRRYFYRIKVQVLVTASSGIPVEFCLVSGRESDVQALKKLPMAVARGSIFMVTVLIPNYAIEDDIKEADLIQLMIQRKSNSKRKDEPCIRFLQE